MLGLLGNLQQYQAKRQHLSCICLEYAIKSVHLSLAKLDLVCCTKSCNAPQGSWKGKSAIIGFFWTASADCDFVMVTRGGLELYTLAADRQACPSCHHYALNETHFLLVP